MAKLWKPLSCLLTSAIVITPVAMIATQNQATANATPQLATMQTFALSKAKTVNPTTAYYVSEDLFSLNVWDDKKDKPNQANLNKFKQLKENLEKTNDPNLEQLKTELVQTIDQVQGYHDYHQAKKAFAEFGSSTDAAIAWEDIKASVLQAYGNPPENWDDFENLKNINEQLLTISGITNDNQSVIETLSYQQLKTQDLLNSSTPNPTTDDIATVAGTDYKMLVKIATLDPTKAGIYQLNFQLDQKDYVWIIDNQTNQLGKDLTNFSDQLISFGRLTQYQDLKNKPLELGNFVLKATTVNEQPVVDVMVRLKQNQTMSQIQFSQPNSEQDQTLSPLKFGILDVQLKQDQTFQSLINNHGKTKAATTLIDPATNTQDSKTQAAKTIQFFNQSTVMTKATNNDQWQTNPTNQHLTWYSLANQPLSFNLNLINANVATKPQFKPLYDVQSGLQQILKPTYDGQSVPTLANQSLLINKTTFEKLPELVQTNWDQLSSLKLSASTTKGFAKQTLSFNNHIWYLDFDLNHPTFSPDLNQDQTFVLKDIRQAIFFESPRDLTFNNNQDSTLAPTIKDHPNALALKTVANLIKNYQDPQNPIAKMEISPNLKVLQWDQIAKLTNLASVTTSLAIFNDNQAKTYHDLWSYLNTFINQANQILKQIFGQTIANQLDPNRYQNQDSLAIVNQWFNINNPYLTNFNQSQVVFNQISNIVNDFKPNQDPSADQIKALNYQVEILITYQLEAIVNQFQALALIPFYQQLTNLINDPTKSQKSVIDGNQIKLLTINEHQFATLEQPLKATKVELTVQQQLISLIKLLRHDQVDLALGLLKPIQRQTWSTYDETKLTTFDPNEHIAINFQKAFLWVNIFAYFGFDLISPYLNQATIDPTKPLQIFDLNQQKLLNFDQGLETLITNLIAKPQLIKTIIAGFNIYQVLNQKLLAIANGTYQSPVATISNQQLVSAINQVLNQPVATNQQLEGWNLIISGDPNQLNRFINDLSTFNQANFTKIINAINDDQNIIKILNLFAPDWKREPANPQLIGIISGATLGGLALLAASGFIAYAYRKENFQKYQSKVKYQIESGE